LLQSAQDYKRRQIAGRTDRRVTAASLEAGVSYAHLAGVAHNVVNVNDYEFRFVEIELK
jgi:hypothetical protein